MRLGNFATGIILARFFLGPEAWGVYGIAQTVLLVLLSANELGVSLAIVRWEEIRAASPRPSSRSARCPAACCTRPCSRPPRPSPVSWAHPRLPESCG